MRDYAADYAAWQAACREVERDREGVRRFWAATSYGPDEDRLTAWLPLPPEPPKLKVPRVVTLSDGWTYRMAAGELQYQDKGSLIWYRSTFQGDDYAKLASLATQPYEEPTL